MIKKLMLLLILTICPFTFAASRSTSGNAVVSSTTNWTGGNKPNCTSDTIVATTAFDLTIDVNCTAGSNASPVGHAIEIQGTSAGVRARVFLGTGVTLTLRGFDTGSNTAMLIDQFGLFQCDTGGTIMVDEPGDMVTIIRNNGNLTSNGCTWTIPTANINWGNASGNTVFGGVTGSPYKVDSSGVGVYVNKLQLSGGTLDPGAVSNVAGTGRCSFGDDSLTVTAGTSWTTAKSSYAAVVADGDYYHDCITNAVFFYSHSVLLTVTYHFLYETHLSWGILSEANATGSSVLFTNNIVKWAGSNGSSQAEHLGGGLLFNDRYSCAIDPTRCMLVTGNEFDDCTNCIQIYQDNTQGTASTVTNPILVTGNVFNGAHYNTNIWATGVIAIGNASNIKVDGTGGSWYSFAQPFRTKTRGDMAGIIFTHNTGVAILNNMLPADDSFDTVGGSFATNNTMSGFGAEVDVRLIAVGGNPTVGINLYDSNIFGNAHRVAGILPYATVTNNLFYETYHHGCGPMDGNSGYYSHFIFQYNSIIDSDDANFGGGCTMSYNHEILIDCGSAATPTCALSHNSFNGGTRGFRTNDQEGSTGLWVGVRMVDSIVSNSAQGFIDVANDATNVVFGAPVQVDWNNAINNTTTTPSITLATFVKGGVEYNSGTKTVAGVNVWNPQGYTFPDATNRSLTQVTSNVSGVNKSVTLQWGGGTASANLVLFQRVGVGVSGTTGSAGTFPTLTDTGATFTTTGSKLRGQQIIIVLGTGAGQSGMIGGNDATHLDPIIPYTTNNRWAVAPDSTSVYLIVQSQVTLTDVGGVNTIYAGIRVPDLDFTNTTHTDNNITLVTHSLAVNPQFVSSTGAAANMHIQNSALSTSASDGTFIGALPLQSTNSSCGLFSLMGVGC